MNLVISKTASPPTSATHVDATADTIFYAIGKCALGPVLVARGVAGVCAILLGADHNELAADLASRFAKAKRVVNEAVMSLIETKRSIRLSPSQ